MSSPSRTQGERADVLLVDDDADLREILETVLSEEGYRVQVAAGGAEALDYLAREAPPELLLLDLLMPGLDGREVLQALGRSPRRGALKVVLMSGDLRAASACGPVDGVLLKPVRLEALLATVARWCGPRSAGRGGEAERP